MPSLTPTAVRNYTRNYKWIDREIEKLDPNVDYERIWRLATTYRASDFQMGFFYVYAFAHFFIAPNGTEVIVRNGRGKVFTNPDKRADDTTKHQLTWWEHGPHAEETKRSVAQVNKIHAALGRQYPGRLANGLDFIYTLCLEAASAHRLRVHVGAPGFNPEAKIAAYRFWTEMVPLFTTEDGSELHGWPGDFDGLLDFMTSFEAKQWDYSENGRIALDAVVGHFGRRYFPAPLRWLARPFCLALLPDHILPILRVSPPRPFVSRAVKLLLRSVMFVTDKVLPDPKTSITERAAK